MVQHEVLQPHFDSAEVIASVVIAAIASYAALTLAARVGARRGRAHRHWILGGGVAMGLGIAAMHFVGIVAMRLPVIALSVVILVGAIVAAFVDQHARREARELQLTLEHRLAEHEAEAAMATELYAQLAEHATDMVSTHRPDGQFDYVTPSWSDFLGVPISAIVGHVPIEFAHPDDVQLLIENHARGLRSLTVITTVWRCRKAVTERDGSPRYAWLETSTRPVRETPTGHVQTFVCATRDVTERKRMEEQLARSEARFRAAIDGSFDGFLVLEAVRNSDGKIVDFIYSELNPRAEALIARPRWQVIGRRMSDVFPSTAERYLEKLAGVVDTRTPLEEEVEAQSSNGSRQWLHHQIIPLGDGVAITARDVTDQKHAQEELRALTLVDELTGLYNRRGFLMLAEQHMRLIKRGGPVSILVSIDLDGFKGVNDVYGHAEGDVALRRVANVLRIAFRDSDIIARFGGDEFVVLALDCGEMRDTLIERVMTALEADNTRAARPYSLSLST